MFLCLKLYLNLFQAQNLTQKITFGLINNGKFNMFNIKFTLGMDFVIFYPIHNLQILFQIRH